MMIANIYYTTVQDVMNGMVYCCDGGDVAQLCFFYNMVLYFTFKCENVSMNLGNSIPIDRPTI